MNDILQDPTVEEYIKMPYRMKIVEDQEEGGYAMSLS